MAELDETEKTYSLMERLLFYTLPVLFTVLLTGVLLTMFGYDVTNELLRAANKIPVVSGLVPDPKPTAAELEQMRIEAEKSRQAERTGNAEESEATLSLSMAAKEAEIAALESKNAQMDARIKELQAEVERLQNERQQQLQSDEEYAANIQSLAALYASMSASKAAPVLENLTPYERMLVLKAMPPDAQVKVMEKMKPELAASTSILMKDSVPVKDLQMAALQERIALSEGSGTGSEALSKDEVSRSFARMAPNRAAEVLLEMAKANEEQVIAILRLMEEGARAEIMNSLANISKEQTAAISAKLG